MYKRILLIGAEVHSTGLDFSDLSIIGKDGKFQR